MMWSAASASTTALGSRLRAIAVAAATAGPRIPPQRFDHHSNVNADVLCLAAREEMEIRAGDDDRRGEHRVLHPQQRLLVGRMLADQRQKLFGQGVARDRPQPRSGTAGEQDWNDRRAHDYSKRCRFYLFGQIHLICHLILKCCELSRLAQSMKRNRKVANVSRVNSNPWSTGRFAALICMPRPQ